MSKEDIPLLKQKLVTKPDDVCISMDAEMFKDMFNLMASLILTEVQVKIEANGLRVRQMEESRVAMTDMFVPKEYFKTLKAGQRIKEMRLPVRDMKNILARLSHGDVIELTVGTTGKLHIEIKGRRTRVFEIPLFEPEDIESREPKVPLNVRVKTAMEGVLLAVKDAEMLMRRGTAKKKKELFGMITLTTMPMGLHVKSDTGSGMYSAESTLTSGWDIMKFDGKLDQSVTVSLPYLIAIITAIAKATNMIQMEFSTDMPLHIIAELPFKDARLSFWLAPRIRIEEKEVEA